MFDAFRQFTDRLLGRGSAAITVPVMDGALKPDRSLDRAKPVATLADIDDLATDGQALFATAGPCLYRLEGSAFELLRRFDAEITALAVRAPGAMAVALDGSQVRLLALAGGNWTDGARLDRIGAQPLNGVNALRFEPAGALLLSDGSTRRGPALWCHDLMEKGRSGRVARWHATSDKAELLADGLAYAFGVLPLDGAVLYSESWRHRVVRAASASATPVLADLPAYPSRMAPASGGGFWLSCFACRTQLVEFVLREDAYRRRMMAEVDPRYWIAPALRSGASFLEPLQGAGVKQMGQLKPWAPPRSYGLVLRVDAQGRTLASLHSQVDGQHHGITALTEFAGALYAASKGSGRLLRIDLAEAGSNDMNDIVLELRKATKKYAGVPAIEDVDFTLQRGEIHALLGENGAGKSTLTKVMAGVVPLSDGQMRIEGAAVQLRTPLEARHRGIAMVFQETSLVPTMTVAQNLYLGQEVFFNRLRGVYIAAQQFLQSLNFDVDPTATVGSLGAAKKQMVEIARAVLHKARIIIFDEPTASLTPEEKKYFFDLVFNLKARGVSVIFISHALEEALLLADRITVLRDGHHVVTDLKQNFDRARIVQAMVGRDLSQTLYGQKKTTVRPQGECLLSVRNLRMAAMVKNNSLSVFAGQITGVFGLVGAGRTETFKVVAGLIKRDFFHGGEVLLRGKPVRYKVARSAVRDGIAYITEDRKFEGFFETMSISQNIYMGLLGKVKGAFGPVSGARAKAVGEHWIKLLNVRAIGKDVKVIELSGGNQQKVVIAKSLVQEPDVIIFDEPTRGVDVGAIAEIHAEINRLADAGKAVVVISSYLPEVMALSDRILVAKQGKVVTEFSATEATQEDIMYAAIH